LFAYLKEKQITTIVATHDSSDVLSFSDEVIVMQNGKIIASHLPKNLYQNPTNKYIASLFGDVNEIVIDGKILFVYPHQFKEVPKSQIKVVVTNVYYKGSHYLVEAQYNNQTLFFENTDALIVGDSLCLSFK
jgi:ABC-type Fe3+/spermidine/putrescine transport system ATPase subunit